MPYTTADAYIQLGYNLSDCLPPEARDLSEDKFWEWFSQQLSETEKQGIFDWWMRARNEPQEAD